jgi:hypothetical protein
MPLFGSQRRRKPTRSTSPTGTPPPSNNNNKNNSNSVLSNSAASIRSRAKKRLGIFGGGRTEPADVLPTTRQDATFSPARRTSAPVNNNCNSFLLGGNYYPGKDKKRRVLRRKTLWYHVCWSSPTRIAVTVLLVTYFLFWHALTPFIQSLLSLGAFLSSSNGSILRGYDLLHDGSSLQQQNMPSISQDSKAAQQLAEVRQELRHTTRQERLHLLEKVDHVFFHRNDPHSAGEGNGAAGEVQPQPQQVPRSEKTQRKDDDDNKAEKRHQLRTLDTMHNFADKSHCPSVMAEHDIKTTLVIQTSLDRLWVLNETCARWRDPIVAVVAVMDDENQSLIVQWEEKCPQLKLIVHTLTDKEAQDPEMYPVNALRNLALDAVNTSHVLVVDVDFVPSSDLHEKIRSVLKERMQLRQHQPDIIPATEREAIIVPAFERILSPPCSSDEDCMEHLRTNSSFIPHNFGELLSCYKSKDCIVFQSDVNPPGHSSTRSDEWLQRQWYDESKSLPLDDNSVLKVPRSLDCFDSYRYEPYLVIRWCPAGQSATHPVAPFYDERFHGYGKNKIEYVQHLRMMGYRYAVLPEGFIVHNPHVESKAKQKWNDKDDSGLHSDMDQLYIDFLHELFEKYHSEIQKGILEQC